MPPASLHSMSKVKVQAAQKQPTCAGWILAFGRLTFSRTAPQSRQGTCAAVERQTARFRGSDIDLPSRWAGWLLV